MGVVEIYCRPGDTEAARLAERARGLGLGTAIRDIGRELERWSSCYDGLSRDEIERGLAILRARWRSGGLPVVWAGGRALGHPEAEDLLLRESRGVPAAAAGS